MPKKKKQRKKTKKKNRQPEQVVDPVTRAGLPPGLVLPQLDAEALLRPVAEQMASVLTRALANRPPALSELLARAAARRETEEAQKTLHSKPEPSEDRGSDTQA
jgi:hypothetical protein